MDTFSYVQANPDIVKNDFVEARISKSFKTYYRRYTISSTLINQMCKLPMYKLDV